MPRLVGTPKHKNGSKGQRFWWKHTNNPRPAKVLSSAAITIAIGKHSLTYIHKNTACEMINTTPIQEYWMKTDDIAPEEWEIINWWATTTKNTRTITRHAKISS
jgi:hypothetical protein